MTKPYTLLGTPVAVHDPDLLTKVYAANPIMAYRGIGLEYYLSHPHQLYTVAAIEELAAAGSEAVRDYPQDYLPLLPHQLVIQRALDLAGEFEEFDAS